MITHVSITVVRSCASSTSTETHSFTVRRTGKWTDAVTCSQCVDAHIQPPLLGNTATYQKENHMQHRQPRRTYNHSHHGSSTHANTAQQRSTAFHLHIGMDGECKAKHASRMIQAPHCRSKQKVRMMQQAGKRSEAVESIGN